MDKEDLRKIIKKEVEDVWYNRRSLNPVEDQTDRLTEKIWEAISNISWDELKDFKMDSPDDLNKERS